MISVIVVAHESGEVLLESLASAAPLAAAGHEVWLVDNASTDGWVDEAERRFPFVHMIRLSENVGFGPANNVAARRATGDRLLLLNPDARLAEGCAERLSAALDADPRLAQVAPATFFPDGRTQHDGGPTLGVVGEAIQIARKRRGSAWVGAGLARLAAVLGDQGWLSGSCFLARREAWEAVGGFDERFFLYFEDADLSVRLRAAGWRIGRCRDAVVHHHSGTPGAHELLYRRSQLLYYRLHRPAWENRFLLRRLRRKFARVADGRLREDLLALADTAEHALR